MKLLFCIAVDYLVRSTRKIPIRIQVSRKIQVNIIFKKIVVKKGRISF